MLPLLLLAMACGAKSGSTPDADRGDDRAAIALKATPGDDMVAARGNAGQRSSVVSNRIDEAPKPTQVSKIVGQHDDLVNGKPACAMTVRYNGQLEQPVTWNGETCRSVTAMFIDADRLKSLGRFDALTEETRDDIVRTGGQVLYLEGEFSAALYPLNSAATIPATMTA
jgi:hypothetical protein